MLIRTRTSQSSERKGVILLVVISLLTLFAIVGLSFVLYANAEANASKIYREAANQNQIDMEPELLFNMFLGQLIYDVNDDYPGVYSAMRGQSLTRSMYGYNYPTAASPTVPPNTVPFNGVGRLHTGAGSFMNPFSVDDWQLVNYTYYPGETFSVNGSPPLPFLRDPERINPRSMPAPGQTPWRNTPNPTSDLPGPYTGGFNVPYTYPDLNNMFLAAVKADGTVLAPSFHRTWTGFGSLDPSNPNWNDTTNPALKYMVLRPRPAENPAFPAPEDGGGDVKNLPGPGTLVPGTGPGTPNPAQYWNNDSMWMDVGAPVMTAPNGTKFKPLFAPLILDLDGRVNLNVAGNIRGLDSLAARPQTPFPVPAGQNMSHRSNQGWGPWEINLEYVLNKNDSNNAYEWPNIFLGKNFNQGRYGANQWPTFQNNPLPAGTATHFYGQVDYDGADEGMNYGVTQQVNYTPAGTAAFPIYPNTGYGSGFAELVNHPSLYNYFQPKDPTNTNFDDNAFGLSNMEALLRYGDTNSAALTSDLFRLCPLNFSDPRVRNLVTTLSFDVDQPGNSPWVWNPGDASSSYSYPAPGGMTPPDYTKPPPAPPIPFPALSSGAPPAGSEFNVDWRAIDAALGKVNLNRYLTPYPSYSDATHQMLTTTFWSRYDDNAAAFTQFQQAQTDRQQLAQDIYDRLRAVTGAQYTRSATPAASELAPLRWLAQLAVNIVDFIDTDDISTPFHFYPEMTDTSTTQPESWVFGTELPHVVLNEALAEFQDSNPAPIPGADPITIGIWTELFNPFQTPPASTQQQDGQPVVLNIPAGGISNITGGPTVAYAPYKLVTATGPLTTLSSGNDNVLGEPNPPILCQTADADFNPAMTPSMTVGNPPGSQPPQGTISSPYIDLQTGVTATPFFIVGPKSVGLPKPAPQSPDTSSKAIAAAPAATPWLQTTSMQTPPAVYTYSTAPTAITVFLRRLANPHLPAQTNPGLPWYNPYISVDYMDGVKVNNMSPGATPAPTPDSSQGKRQPYAGYFNTVPAMSQVVPQTSTGNTTNTTFGYMNNPGPTSGAYSWLVHLDRALISPMELLQVSAYQPWQLTHYFIDAGGNPFAHRVPWFDEGLAGSGKSYRLYRLFEFLETGPRGAGMTPGGRIPGKININTIWDPEILLALCDPQTSNNFVLSDIFNPGNQYDANTLFGKLMTLRNPGISSGTIIGPGDKPFLGLGTGYTSSTTPDIQNPGGIGIDNTLLRNANDTMPSTPPRRWFQPASQYSATAQPYVYDQLITKLFNNVATRSNVFAVWVTVGFFEVTDDTSRPVKLGAEIGKAENRHIRHRMFAIVDRSNLTMELSNSNRVGPPPVYVPMVSLSTNYFPPPAVPPYVAPPNTYVVPRLTGSYEGIPWSIGQFTNVLVDTGNNQEIAMVASTSTVSIPSGNPNPLNLPPVQSITLTGPVTATGPTNPFSKPHSLPVAITPLSTLTVALPTSPPTVGPGTGITLTLNGTSLNAIQPGVNVLVDIGQIGGAAPTAEIATVQSVTQYNPVGPVPPTITLNLTLPHYNIASNPLTISYPIPTPGNAGPQPNFNMRQVPWVVRYFSIIN